MKKILAICISAALALCSCQTPAPTKSTEESPPIKSSSADPSLPDSTPAERQVAVKEISPESGDLSPYYFKNNLLKIEDATIEIKKYKVIPVGEKGNEYGNKPVIAFWYTTLNESDKSISATTAWIACFTAIQDNDPNIINKLNVGILPDDRFLDTQMADIKPGGSIENAIAYELTDLETPVILKATKGVLGESLGEQEFPVNLPDTHNSDIPEASELFNAVYVKYASREKPFEFDAVKVFAEGCGYNTEINNPTSETIGSIKITDKNGDYVYFAFNSTNGVETIMTVSYFQKSSNSETSMSNYSTDGNPAYDKFSTHILGASEVEVNGIDEQKSFLYHS